MILLLEYGFISNIQRNLKSPVTAGVFINSVTKEVVGGRCSNFQWNHFNLC